jgi:hypothetical protein
MPPTVTDTPPSLQSGSRLGSLLTYFGKASRDGLASNLGAIAGATVLLAGGPTYVGAFLVVGAVVGMLVHRWRIIIGLHRQIAPTGTYVVSRIVLALSVGLLAPRGDNEDVSIWVAAGVLASLAAAELTLARIARAAIPFAANLPGTRIRNSPVVSPGWVFAANTSALLVCVALALAGAPAPWILVVALLPIPLAALVLGDAVLRITSRMEAERGLAAALDELAPKFALHFDAPASGVYQATMWLPYLDRIGEPYFVILRNPAHFEQVTALTSAPVVVRRDLEDMDSVAVPSLRAAFYVNTAAKNAHFVRYRGMKHIQINHGDSDKAPSYSKAFRVFDYNFVAGQAAIDRFESHGVETLPGSLVIVGRPQVEAIRVDDAPIGLKPEKTVLYAPTWAGFHLDVNYSSLPIGVDIVRALLSKGVRVIFRPHPQTGQNPALAREAERIVRMLESDRAATGRPHVWGDEAGRRMSIIDCFNSADALVTDVSSVAPDFLYSEKPFAITAMVGSSAEFEADFPLARAAYVIEPGAQIEEPLDLLLGSDPLQSVRQQLKSYYLGDIPSERYADAFISAARAHVNG